MSRWLVYYNEEYYPSAEVVEADTAEEAASGLSDYERGKGTVVAVAPIEHVQFFFGDPKDLG